MHSVGFSTGALARHLLRQAVGTARDLGLRTIELSALRVGELAALADFVGSEDLTDFQYVSIHAPTDFEDDQEAWVTSLLIDLAKKYQFPVVVHPDCFHDETRWLPLQHLLCIENMDKRKAVGRTLEELAPIFRRFPFARLCFDAAHAQQIDASMTEAFRILRAFRGRITQIHLSEVTSSSRHTRLTYGAVGSFGFIRSQLKDEVPVILESPVRTMMEAVSELQLARRLFELEKPLAVSID
jgi:sugar phosphate isomerase/epimerase